MLACRPDLAQGGHQLGEPLADRLARADPYPGFVGNPEKGGDGENREPERHHGPDDADVLGLLLVEAEQRALGLDEQDQQEAEACEAAHIAEAPAPAGQPPYPLFGHKAGQHRVIEDVADLERSIGDHEEGQRPQHVRGVGARVPEESAVATTVIATKTPSHGLRRPVRSAMDPRTGLSTAIRTPETASACPQAAVPSIGLSATAREK